MANFKYNFFKFPKLLENFSIILFLQASFLDNYCLNKNALILNFKKFLLVKFLDGCYLILKFLNSSY